jgi:pimeloyl-ACP methyl ester carboxylesterase
MPNKKSYLQLLEPSNNDPNKPLFIYLSGMDGTGQLLHLQADGLTKYFALKCLVIPPEDLSDWDFLTHSVIYAIKEVLETNKQKSIYLCGESFGGCLALSVATAAPGLVERLILVNPASSFANLPWMSWGSTLTQWLPEFIHHGASLALLPFLAALERIKRRDRLALLEAMRSLPQRTVSWRIFLLRKFAIEPEKLQKFVKPVLLVASAADRLLPSVDEAERLIDILPNAKMLILPKSGHACLIESDVNFVQILKEAGFLKLD